MSRLARAVRWLDRRADGPGFLPRVAVFPLLDYALPFLPNQMLLVAVAFLHPVRWLAFAATFALASAAGAGLIALAVQTLALGLTAWLTANVEAAGTVFDFVRDYGLWGLAALALLPAPPRTGVLLCAVGGLSPFGIAAAVLAGRLFAATVIAWLAAKAPDWLRRVPGMRARLDAFEAMRNG